MQANPEQAAVLCVDSHVRVYQGHLTKLPRPLCVSTKIVSTRHRRLRGECLRRPAFFEVKRVFCRVVMPNLVR